MKVTALVFLGTLLALLLISAVATEDETKMDAGDETIHVNDEKYYGGGGGWGGGGRGGGGWGGGGRGGGGGWGRGGGGCRWGCCGRGKYGGGCGKCCYSAQEAIAYMQNEAQP